MMVKRFINPGLIIGNYQPGEFRIQAAAGFSVCIGFRAIARETVFWPDDVDFDMSQINKYQREYQKTGMAAACSAAFAQPGWRDHPGPGTLKNGRLTGYFQSSHHEEDQPRILIRQFRG
jgi:hypothetical protein